MGLDKREGVSMLGYGKSNHMTRFLNTFPKFLYYRSDRGLISLSERMVNQALSEGFKYTNPSSEWVFLKLRPL
jgi:hypothetical protein